MKRGVGKRSVALLLLAVFLFLIPTAAALATSTQTMADPDALETVSAKISRTTKGLVLRMQFINQGDTALTEFGLALAFYGSDGERIFANPTTLDGYTDDINYWYYTPSEAIQPGETYQTEDTFAGYPKAGRMEIAIRYYQKDTGEYVNIPESEWAWFSTQDGAAEKKLNRTCYGDPASDLTTLPEGVSIGYSYYLLDDFNASFYGHSQGGEWITEVDIGSLADAAGLQAGDLVLTVDGVKPTENLFAVEYAMPKIAAGESVTWEMERDGTVYAVDFVLPE